MRRYWVNQPSIHQPDHRLHGLKVHANVETADEHGCVTAYPITGSVTSLVVFVASLSEGWGDA